MLMWRVAFQKIKDIWINSLFWHFQVYKNSHNRKGSQQSNSVQDTRLVIICLKMMTKTMKVDKISKRDPIVKGKEGLMEELIGQLKRRYAKTFIDSSKLI